MLMEKITVQQTMTAVLTVYAPQNIPKNTPEHLHIVSETYIFSREYHRILRCHHLWIFIEPLRIQ